MSFAVYSFLSFLFFLHRWIIQTTVMDNGGIHRFSNFHYTSPYLTRYRCAASKIAGKRGRVDQRADERVVTIAFLDQLLKPDYAHALSIELPSIVSPPSIPNENSPPRIITDRHDLLHLGLLSKSSFPTVSTQVKLPSMDGRKSRPVVSAWISIAPGFLAITKQEIRSRRERESVCMRVRDPRPGTGTERERGKSLSLSLRIGS